MRVSLTRLESKLTDVDKSIKRALLVVYRAGKHQMGNRCRCIYVFGKLTRDPAATGLLSPLIRMTTTANESSLKQELHNEKCIAIRHAVLRVIGVSERTRDAFRCDIFIFYYDTIN